MAAKVWQRESSLWFHSWLDSSSYCYSSIFSIRELSWTSCSIWTVFVIYGGFYILSNGNFKRCYFRTYGYYVSYCQELVKRLKKLWKAKTDWKCVIWYYSQIKVYYLEVSLEFFWSEFSQYSSMPWFDHPDNPSDPRAAILLTFLAGIILLGMAVFKLGFLERVLKLSNFVIQYNLYLSFKWDCLRSH